MFTKYAPPPPAFYTLLDVFIFLKPFISGEFLILTAASKVDRDFRRLQESASINSLPLKVLGTSQGWMGFGQKMMLLKKELEAHKGHPDRIVMFINSVDVLFNARTDQIVDKFMKLEAKIVFPAESLCWPDASLASRYLPVALFFSNFMFV